MSPRRRGLFGPRAGKLSRKALPFLIKVYFFALVAVTTAQGADYYVNSLVGNDSNSGTAAGAPWSTFANLANHSLSPGDTLNLATGCSWNAELDLYGSGTVLNPIVVQPYGPNAMGNQSSGAMAIISRNGQPGDHCIYLHNPNHWQIVGLELANADTALYVAADNNATNNNGLLVYRCFFLNCAVSDSVQTPSAGVFIGAPDTLTAPTSYLAGIQISGNFFSNCSAAWWINADSDGYDSVFQMNIQNNYVENQRSQSYATRSTGTLVQDNWFQHCATVELTTGGDTVVTTGLTTNMAFVNNVFAVVPDLGANDQTAVDEEVATTNQAYFGNVFYDTAGAGVEVADIHGLGYGSVGSFFDGNLFYENGWSATGMPDAVGTYETAGDTLSGALNNNLYYEPDSGWLFTFGLADWTQSNNVSVDNPGGLYNAALDFGGTQGSKQWFYAHGSPSAGWGNIGGAPSDNDADYAWAELQYGDASQGWITTLDMGPPANSGAWIARVWTAPSAGTISIRGFVQNARFPNQGPPAGAIAQISGWTPNLVSGTIHWGGDNGQAVNGGGYSTDLDGIVVSAGEQIAFAVKNEGSGSNLNAAVSWVPTIYFNSSASPVVSIVQGIGGPVPNGRSTISLVASAAGSSFQWFLNGVRIPGATGSTLAVAATAANAGDYAVTATNGAGASTADAGTLTVTTNAWLDNLAVRAYSEPGTNQLIAGFVTAGSGNKSILVRGVGPSLAGFGISNFLSDPSLSFYSNASLLAATTGWSGALESEFQHLGAFDFVPASHDTALVETVSPGPYTAEVVSQTTQSGVALAEIYDADGGAPTNRLTNLSARANVGSGSHVLIAGFVISGTTPLTVVIRGDGPALAAFGVSGFLANPTLTLSGANGIIASNTGWGNLSVLGSSALGPIIVQPLTKGLEAKVQTFPLPQGSNDSGLVVTLPPGAYTAEISGPDGATGIALVEVYELR